MAFVELLDVDVPASSVPNDSAEEGEEEEEPEDRAESEKSALKKLEALQKAEADVLNQAFDLLAKLGIKKPQPPPAVDSEDPDSEGAAD